MHTAHNALFLRLIAVEMRRGLHRRLVRWMLALALALCALAAVISFVSSSDAVKLALDDEHPAKMLNWWQPGGGGILEIAAIALAVGGAICGASFAGAEWRAGTMTTTLTWEPQRLRLHGARTAAAALESFLLGLALQAVFLGAFVPAVVAHGNSNGVDRDWWIALVLAMLRIALIGSLCTVLAVSVATIGRNTSAALVVLAAWALVVERVVVGLKPSLGRFMISENVATVVPWKQLDDSGFDRSPTLALTSLLGYLAAVVVVASVGFHRRDVAATT